MVTPGMSLNMTISNEVNIVLTLYDCNLINHVMTERGMML